MRRLVVIPIYVTDCFHNWTPRSSSGSCTQVPDGRLSRTKSVPLEIWTMPRHGPAGRLFHLQEMERMGAWYGTVRFWRYCCLFHTLTTNQAVLIHRPTPWPHPRSYKHEWMKKEKIGLAIQANGLHLPWAPRVRRRSSHTVWYVHTLVLQFPTWSSYRSSDSRSSSPTNPRSYYGQCQGSLPKCIHKLSPAPVRLANSMRILPEIILRGWPGLMKQRVVRERTCLASLPGNGWGYGDELKNEGYGSYEVRKLLTSTLMYA